MAAPDRTRGFWRWVKNPWVRRRAERDDAELAAELDALDPDRVSEAEVARLVDGLLRQGLMFPVTQKFDRLGRRAVPQLVRAVSDPRYLRPYRDSGTARLPLGAVLDLLEPFAPPEIVGRLAELATHSQPAVREAAARGLGNLATPAALSAWLAVSRDPDGDMCSAAV
jgi:HEAT repeat protein